MLKTFKGSICAGIAIAMGGSVFLACFKDNKLAGAVLFSVALLCICFKGYVLFTGRIGYVVEKHKGRDIAELAVGLAGNLITTFLLGLLIRYAVPSLGDVAEGICVTKLEQSVLSTFIRGCFCGVLMYLAVSTYKEKNTVCGILFCIPVFILSGFEHSIADMFYFGAAKNLTPKMPLFILMVVLGNTVGAIVLPLLACGKKEK